MGNGGDGEEREGTEKPLTQEVKRIRPGDGSGSGNGGGGTGKAGTTGKASGGKETPQKKHNEDALGLSPLPTPGTFAKMEDETTLAVLQEHVHNTLIQKFDQAEVDVINKVVHSMPPGTVYEMAKTKGEGGEIRLVEEAEKTCHPSGRAPKNDEETWIIGDYVDLEATTEEGNLVAKVSEVQGEGNKMKLKARLYIGGEEVRSQRILHSKGSIRQSHNAVQAYHPGVRAFKGVAGGGQWFMHKKWGGQEPAEQRARRQVKEWEKEFRTMAEERTKRDICLCRNDKCGRQARTNMKSTADGTAGFLDIRRR